MKIETLYEKFESIIDAFRENQSNELIRNYQESFKKSLGQAIKSNYGTILPKAKQISIQELEKKSKEQLKELEKTIARWIEEKNPRTSSYFTDILALPLIPIAAVYLLININQIEREAREDGNKGMSSDYCEKNDSPVDTKLVEYYNYKSEQHCFSTLNVGINSSNIDAFIKEHLPYFENSDKAVMAFHLYIQCQAIKTNKELESFKQHYKDLCEHKMLPKGTIFTRQRTNEAIISAFEKANMSYLQAEYANSKLYNEAFLFESRNIVFIAIAKKISGILGELMAYPNTKESDILRHSVAKENIKSIMQKKDWISLIPYIEKYQHFDLSFEPFIPHFLETLSDIQPDGTNNDSLIKTLKNHTEKFLKEEIKIDQKLLSLAHEKEDMLLKNNILPEIKNIIAVGILERISIVLDALITESKENIALKEEKETVDKLKQEKFSEEKLSRLQPYIDKYLSVDPGFKQYKEDLLVILSNIKLDGKNYDFLIESVNKRTNRFLEEEEAEIRISKKLLQPEYHKQKKVKKLPNLFNISDDEISDDESKNKSQDVFSKVGSSTLSNSVVLTDETYLLENTKEVTETLKMDKFEAQKIPTAPKLESYNNAPIFFKDKTILEEKKIKEKKQTEDKLNIEWLKTTYKSEKPCHDKNSAELIELYYERLHPRLKNKIASYRNAEKNLMLSLEGQEETIGESYCCHISYHVPAVPVTIGGGVIYDLYQILSWYHSNPSDAHDPLDDEIRFEVNVISTIDQTTETAYADFVQKFGKSQNILKK